MPTRSRSIWYETAAPPSRPSLPNDVTVQACVIGAGIAGLSVAYTLAKAGKTVIVLEKEQIASGESGRTTAHLSNAIDDRFVRLEKAFGVHGSRIAAESHTSAIARIESVVRDEGIDCDFARVDGYLFLGEGDEPGLLDDELAATHRAGLTDVTRVERTPGLDDVPALRFPRQGRFHVTKYLAGLATAIERHGGTICCGTKVDNIEGGTPATVTTSAGKVVTADDVIVCTNGAISDMYVTHTKQAPYRTFALALSVPKGSVADALYWDTLDPYHYVRLQPLDATRDALIVGGEDVKTAHEDDADQRFDTLEHWARERWPIAGERITQWSGQVLEPVDYLAFIGPNPDGAAHVWLATGDSGMGMTHGTIAGILLPALIADGRHPWASLSDPKRITLHASELLELAKESADVALQFADYVTPGEAADVEQIPRGEGRVIRRGLHKIAAYVDESGTVHECSAVCTHLRCIVGWNSAEKSWDCPCHGSRFDPTGKVLNGPATKDLEPVDGGSVAQPLQVAAAP
jgi:glycine/D-amino acid oxidase-like deaminating enzyme/nitrite reductase/ring-hydroxylating ferredoxin subunit